MEGEPNGVGLANHTLLIARDGTERPVDDSAAPLSVGGTTGAVLVFRDVTERWRAERERARLAAIVESSEDAIISKTLDGVIRSWNAGAESIFGYTAVEAVGQPITIVIPPERLDEERDILARLRRGERVEHFETVRQAKGGRHIDISLTVSPIRSSDGHVIGASKVARDITARKRADKALRESGERFRALVTAASDMVYRMSPDWTEMSDAVTRERSQAMMDRQLSHMVRLIDDLLDVSRISRNKMELRRTRMPLTDVLGAAVETVGPVLEAGRHELTVSLPDAQICLDADLTRLAQVFGNLLTNSAKYTPPGGQIWLSVERRGGDVAVSVRDTGIGIPLESLPNIFDIAAYHPPRVLRFDAAGPMHGEWDGPRVTQALSTILANPLAVKSFRFKYPRQGSNL